MVARRKKPAHRSMGGNDDGEVRVGEIYLSDAVPDTELFFISQLSCAMKTAGLPIYISKRTPPRQKDRQSSRTTQRACRNFSTDVLCLTCE